MKTTLVTKTTAALTTMLMLGFTVPCGAQVFVETYSPVISSYAAPADPVVVAPAPYAGSPVVYESYRPIVDVAPSPTAVYYGSDTLYSPTTSYYAPTTAYRPVTAYSAGAATACCDGGATTYAPAAPTTTYYAPTTTYYAPVTAYRPWSVYRPTTVYAPVATPGYAAYRPVVVRPKVYVPGQPVRNFFRAVTP